MMAVLTVGPKLCTVIGSRATGVGSLVAGARAETAGSAGPRSAALVVALLVGAKDATSMPRMSHATRAIRIDGLVTECPTQRRPRRAGNPETGARHRPLTLAHAISPRAGQSTYRRRPESLRMGQPRARARRLA